MPRKKGSPNKITGEIKELLADIIHKEHDKMKDALHELNTIDKFKYLQIMCKLLVFVIPKAVEEHNITINEPNKKPSWCSDVAPSEESNNE
jgi:hypothetical protein|tara:strand:- start:319 stop:591 length:273 start_codon:yes stop_codon:yes gene_type:complete